MKNIKRLMSILLSVLLLASLFIPHTYVFGLQEETLLTEQEINEINYASEMEAGNGGVLKSSRDTGGLAASEEVPEGQDLSWIYAGASIRPEQISGLDFSSCRLLVGTSDEAVFLDPSAVLSSCNGIYLLQFSDVKTTRAAYAWYMEHAEFVEVDSGMDIAEEKENASDMNPDTKETVMTESENPFTEVGRILAEEEQEETESVPAYDIALIDTGAGIRMEEGWNIPDGVDAVSVVGDEGMDENGHGTGMIGFIRSQDPDARILSIKALGADGHGDVSAVYAAIRYAMEKNVRIINLSISSRASKDSHIIEEAIRDASEKGILVSGSAGNKGRDVKYYVPGRVDCAMIAGACGEDGMRYDFSNYGETVDCNVVSGSTSEAAALLSGWLSANEGGNPVDIINQGFLFSTDYVPDAEAEADEEVFEGNLPEEESLGEDIPEGDLTEEGLPGEDISEGDLTEEELTGEDIPEGNIFDGEPPEEEGVFETDYLMGPFSNLVNYPGHMMKAVDFVYRNGEWTVNREGSLPTADQFISQDGSIMVPLIDTDSHPVEVTIDGNEKWEDSFVRKNGEVSTQVLDVRRNPVWFAAFRKNMKGQSSSRTTSFNPALQYSIYDTVTDYRYVFTISQIAVSNFTYTEPVYGALLIRKDNGAMRIDSPKFINSKGQTQSITDYKDPASPRVFTGMPDWTEDSILHYLKSEDEALPRVRVYFGVDCYKGKTGNERLGSRYQNLYVGYKDIDDYGALQNCDETVAAGRSLFRSNDSTPPTLWSYSPAETWDVARDGDGDEDTTYITTMTPEEAEAEGNRDFGGTTVWGQGHMIEGGTVYQLSSKLQIQNVKFNMYSSTNQANNFQLATLGYPVVYQIAPGSEEGGSIDAGKDYEEVISGFSPYLRDWYTIRDGYRALYWTCDDSLTFHRKGYENDPNSDYTIEAGTRIYDEDIARIVVNKPVTLKLYIGAPLMIRKQLDEGSSKGTLRISMNGGEGSSSSAHSFRVSLKDPAGQDLPGTFSYVLCRKQGNGFQEGTSGTFSNNGTISIPDDCIAIVKGIPLGSGYLVTETSEAGGSHQAGGVLPDAPAGSGPNAPAFAFTVNIRDAGGKAAKNYRIISSSSDPQFDVKTDNSGSFTFEMQAGKTAVFELPLGFSYSITEAAKERYTNTGKTNYNGTIAASVVTSEWTNLYNAPMQAADFAQSTVEAVKVLTGDPREEGLQDGEFEFALYENSDPVQAAPVATAGNAADGTIRFPLIFVRDNTDHTYDFIVKEVKGQDETITYSEEMFRARVRVTDQGDGRIKADVVYPDGTPRFENKYTKPYEYYDIRISKKVTGNLGDKSKEFTFTVDASNSIVDLNAVASKPEEKMRYTYTAADGIAETGEVRVSGTTLEFRSTEHSPWSSSVKLAHDESLLIENIPQDTDLHTVYTIAEMEADKGGYATTTSGGAVTGTLEKDVGVTFINRRQVALPTGVKAFAGGGIGVTGLLLIGSTALMIRIKRRRKGDGGSR